MLLRTSLVAGVATLFLGAGVARADIVIGLAIPVSGPVATIGDQVRNGATAAIEAANAKGGVLGQKLVLDVQDDACDPRQAVSVANRFVDAHVDLVVGHVCSGASMAASNVYAEAGALMITPASNTAKLTERGLKTIFRVCGRDDQQGQLSAKVIAEGWHDKKIALLHDNSAFGRGLAEATRDNLHKLGVTETIFDAITPGDRDYTAMIARLKSAGIDLVYYGGYQQEMGLLVRQANDQGYHPQFLGTSGIATREFAQIAGPASDGVLFTFNPDPRKQPNGMALAEEFRQHNINPEGFTFYGYTAVQVLTEAIDAAHSAKPSAVAAALRSDRFDTVIGNVGFDVKGDITAPGYVLYVWKDGQFAYKK